MDNPLSILVLGASYGLLPGMKLACAGHIVTFVGRDEEIAAMRASGLTIHLPLRRCGERVMLRAHVRPEPAPFSPAVRTPQTAATDGIDFVILALQEPQFAADEIVALMRRIGRAQLPCLSIMNLPPPPFLRRLSTIPAAALADVYTSMAAWESLDPAKLTLASPDPQAIRLDPLSPGALTVTLASNFKAAPFADSAAQAMLERIARDMSHLKVQSAVGVVRPPVAMRASQSLHVPLTKWPMLIAGNCRCIFTDSIRSIADAVSSDLNESRAIYDAVTALTIRLGVRPGEIVTFDAYASAAAQLIRPSSLARALSGGSTAVERIDRLVLNLFDRSNLDRTLIAPLVERIDGLIDRNKRLTANAPSLGNTPSRETQPRSGRDRPHP